MEDIDENELKEMMAMIKAWMIATDFQLNALRDIIMELVDKCDDFDESVIDNARNDMMRGVLDQLKDVEDGEEMMAEIIGDLENQVEQMSDEWGGRVVYADGVGWAVLDVDNDDESFSIGIDAENFSFEDEDIEALWLAILSITADWSGRKPTKESFYRQFAEAQEAHLVKHEDEDEFEDEFQGEWE